MSASVCANCLSRLRISTTPSRLPSFVLPTTTPFSTTATQQNVVKKKSNAPQGAKFREARGAKIKKKSKERPRPPAPGERRAQRKRIVLSNTNALEVSGLEFLSRENMDDAAKAGQMLALNAPLLDQLREIKSFKTTQNWSLFRQPSTLIRHDTIGLAQDIKDVNASQQDQGFGALTIQKIVTGERGSGKSIHLLQAQSMAFLNGWIVVNIPECQDFVINTSSYAPVVNEDGQTTAPESAAQTYNQPQLAAQLLSRIISANSKILQSLKIIHQHPKSLPFKISKQSNLYTLAEAGANDPTIAPQIFSAFWKELTEADTSSSVSSSSTSSPSSSSVADGKSVTRPPILVTIDGLDHWMGPTLYRNADYKPVHSHQFTLIQHFLSLIFPSSASSTINNFPSGGMVLAATTGSNSPDYPSFKILLNQLRSLESGSKITDKDFPMPTSYAKVDQNVLDLLKHAQATGITELKGLSKTESKGLLEYFARSGILRERITEGFVGERWTLSGGGVIGELAKLGRRVRV